MNDLIGEPGSPVPDTPETPGRGKLVWEIRSDPQMQIVGEQHPYMQNISPESQAWHWHVEPGHYWGYPGTSMPDWLVKILGVEGYL